MAMNRITGKVISDKTEHIQQSIRDIVATPVGSRVMRRDYGSYLFHLIDSAMNPGGRLRLISAIASAIIKWEPRIDLEQVVINELTSEGALEFEIIGSINNDALTIRVAL